MRTYPPLFLLVTLIAGCAVDTTEPGLSPPRAAHFSYSNASLDQPNVVRFRDQFAFGIVDLETDLVAFAGLPDNPKTSIDCDNGSDAFQLANITESGLRSDAIKFIAKSADMNLDVYRLSTFEGFCVSDQLAHGVGRISYHDNDLFETGGGNDTFGWQMGGPVTLSTGGSANLLAHNLWQLLPNGSFRRIYRQVKLSSQ
jgi:hypothetical protein